jgi:nitrogen regulatory protein P-II 1
VKRVEAIIKPYKLDDTKSALDEIGIEGMTVSQVHGFGRQQEYTVLQRGAEHTIKLHPKVKLEIIVADHLAEEVAAVLRNAAGSGRTGDGKIFIMPVEVAVRIRTGERSGPAAS